MSQQKKPVESKPIVNLEPKPMMVNENVKLSEINKELDAIKDSDLDSRIKKLQEIIKGSKA